MSVAGWDGGREGRRAGLLVKGIDPCGCRQTDWLGKYLAPGPNKQTPARGGQSLRRNRGWRDEDTQGYRESGTQAIFSLVPRQWECSMLYIKLFSLEGHNGLEKLARSSRA